MLRIPCPKAIIVCVPFCCQPTAPQVNELKYAIGRKCVSQKPDPLIMYRPDARISVADMTCASWSVQINDRLGERGAGMLSCLDLSAVKEQPAMMLIGHLTATPHAQPLHY
jgi:hypothetical protein